MSGIKGTVRRALPDPVFARVQEARGQVARAVAGTELHRLRQENDRLHDENDRLRDELTAAMAQLGQDVIARSDAVLSSYDRRLAALANRVLDLEERVAAAAGGGADAADANRILAGHEEHAG